MSSIEPAPDSVQLLTTIAEHLDGDWSVERNPYFCDDLRGPAGEKLSCRINGRHLSIQGLLPPAGAYNHEQHRINVTWAKRPQVIAHEIQRRLLPDYRADLAPALELQAERDQAAARSEELTSDLEAILGSRWRRTTAHGGHRRLMSPSGFLRYESRFEVNRLYEAVDIRLYGADPDLARTVARAVAEAAAKR